MTPWAEKQAELLGLPQVEFAKQLRTYIQHIAHMPVVINLALDKVDGLLILPQLFGSGSS